MVERKKTTISDVAKYAGVSKSTVSKYLNKPEELTEEYRNRVAKAVKDLNYVPNNLARSMRTKTMQLALVVRDIENPFFAEIFTHIRYNALKYGYRVFIITTENDMDELDYYINNIENINADGVILCFVNEDHLVDKFDELCKKIPVTFITWGYESDKADSIIIPLSVSMFDITKYLIDLGHKKIAFVGGPADSRNTKEKVAGFKRALASAGLSVPDDYIKISLTGFRAGYHLTQELLLQQDVPDAIVAATDEVAIGVIKCLTHNNYRVPEDIAVTGHDGIFLSYLFDPPITTKEIPIEEVCQNAVDMLVDRINRPLSKSRQLIFHPRLLTRKSTNPDAVNMCIL